MLMRQHIHVDYFDQLYVFNEKTRESDEFNRERGRWIKAQFITLLKNIKYLPIALVNRYYRLGRQDYSMDADAPYAVNGCDCINGNNHAHDLYLPRL